MIVPFAVITVQDSSISDLFFLHCSSHVRYAEVKYKISFFVADSCPGDGSCNSLCFEERVFVLLVRPADFVKNVCAVPTLPLVLVPHNVESTGGATPRR